MECPNCGGEMKIISLIDDGEVIRPARPPVGREQAGKILKHLGIWEGHEVARSPPEPAGGPAPPASEREGRGGGYTYEPVLDDPFPNYDLFEGTSAAG